MQTFIEFIRSYRTNIINLSWEKDQNFNLSGAVSIEQYYEQKAASREKKEESDKETLSYDLSWAKLSSAV